MALRALVSRDALAHAVRVGLGRGGVAALSSSSLAAAHQQQQPAAVGERTGPAGRWRPVRLPLPRDLGGAPALPFSAKADEAGEKKKKPQHPAQQLFMAAKPQSLATDKPYVEVLPNDKTIFGRMVLRIGGYYTRESELIRGESFLFVASFFSRRFPSHPPSLPLSLPSSLPCVMMSVRLTC